ncbi:hypothetical protein [Plantactinospora sonchi]|uniref:DUF4340 domain-containing protein n=1 Tax=Plantactinospora sonchi TaxID=1544735 RepID=A0ABU7RLV7_9ACTN
MDGDVVRSNLRSFVGLTAVALALVAVVRFGSYESPPPPEPWRPTAGFVAAETVALGGDRTLRLWTAPSAWSVESLVDGRHAGAVSAWGDVDRYTVDEVLGGFLGDVPVTDAHAVSVRTHDGATVRARLYDRRFLVPGHVAGPTEPALLVTPLDAAGRPLSAETSVPIAGRT